MKNLLFVISSFIVFLVYSCVSPVSFVDLDIRQPAPITFPPNTKKVLIVDNSFKPKIIDLSSICLVYNDLMDSVRPFLLKTFSKYMEEEKFFKEVEVHPYYPKPLYTYYENDSLLELPLTKEEVQSICYMTNSDVLISLDFIRASFDIPSGKIILKMACVFRSFLSDGTELHKPISLLEENSSILSSNQEYYALILGAMFRENTLSFADKLVDYYIPKWVAQERILFNRLPKKRKEKKDFTEAEIWEKALADWAAAYEQEQNNKKKTKLASDIALASEYLDNVEDASKWIHQANDLLQEEDKSNVAKYVRSYKDSIDKRVKNAPILKEQLNLEWFDFKE